MEVISNQSLRLSAQRALTFNVLCCIRFISIEVIEAKLLMWVYSERELSEDEKDIYYSTSGEILGDFPELINEEVKIFVTDSDFNSLKHLKYLIYARYEEPKLS